MSSPFPDVGLEDWRRRVTEELDGESPETLCHVLPDGTQIHPLYTSEDLTAELPRPARQKNGVRICEIVEAGSPAGVGRKIGAAVRGGSEAIWLRLDRAARLGLEIDEPESLGVIGVDGASLHHGGDLANAFDDLGSGPARIWLDSGANALPMAALWIAYLDEPESTWQGTEIHFGADPLGSLARDGRLPRDLMKLSSEMAALARYAAEHMPGSTAISASSQPYHEAGAGAVEELGLLTATLTQYLRWLADSGLEAGAACGQIGLRLAVGPDIFSEMAKVRAMRLLWTAVLGAHRVNEPPAARIHCVGSRRTLTRQEPELNVLRQAEQAFAGICGTADWVSAWGWDRASGRSSSAATRLARNSLLILREEAAAARTVDPAAGSCLVEALTRELSDSAWELAQEIEAAGGMRTALLNGTIAERLARTATARAAAFEGGRRAITGVSDFAVDSGIGPPIEESAAAYQQEAHSRLEHHRRESAGRGLEEVEFSRHFVVEDLVARSRQGATLAELGLRLGSVEGAESMPLLPRLRDAAPYENVREGEEE